MNNKLEAYLRDKEQKSFRNRTKNKITENMDLFIYKNIKQISMGLVETFNNVVFHGLDTLKVRLQSKCMTEDISQFYKNKVQTKPLISGVTSAGIGSFIAGYCFIYTNDNFLHYFFRKEKNKSSFMGIKEKLDWRGKLLVSYIISDVIKAMIFLPFEARKQRIQLCQDFNQIGVGNIMKYASRAFIPMVVRDIIFRVVTLGSFLNQLQISHKPTLKYDLEEIKDYIKRKEKNREKYSVSYFMDYSTFQIHSKFTLILMNLITCSIVATVLTQPIDVIITKILTQTRFKYKGLIGSYFIITREEGFKKLFYSGLSARISFNTLSAMTVFMMYDSIIRGIKGYYE